MYADDGPSRGEQRGEDGTVIEADSSCVRLSDDGLFEEKIDAVGGWLVFLGLIVGRERGDGVPDTVVDPPPPFKLAC